MEKGDRAYDNACGEDGHFDGLFIIGGEKGRMVIIVEVYGGLILNEEGGVRLPRF